PADHVDYGWIIPYHDEKLSLTYERYKERGTKEQQQGFKSFINDNASWLEDYALFAALKRFYGGRPWVEWDDADLIRYEENALVKARETHADAIEEQRFRQWVFYRQWYWVKYYAAQ